MSGPTGHLRAVAEGHPDALAVLADWCDEQGQADRARKLRRYLAVLARRLSSVAGRVRLVKQGRIVLTATQSGFKSQGGTKALYHLRLEADDLVRKMLYYVSGMFRKEWTAMGEAVDVANLPANLRLIYGGDGGQSSPAELKG
jgi:hypothetical protein